RAMGLMPDLLILTAKKKNPAKPIRRPAFSQGPARLHRGLLMAPALLEEDITVLHIHGDGHLETERN
ncbi:MAG TPA: hypothetical protein VF050_06725, partial [Moraxellaceae bacterium]